MKDVAKIVKRQINESDENNSTLKDGWFVGNMIDEKNDKIIYAIKGKTYDDTMMYCTAFIQSTLINSIELFIKNSSKYNNEWKDWNNK